MGNLEEGLYRLGKEDGETEGGKEARLEETGEGRRKEESLRPHAVFILVNLDRTDIITEFCPF